MKKMICILSAALLGLTAAVAQDSVSSVVLTDGTTACHVDVARAEMVHKAARMTVNMDFDFSGFGLSHDRVALFTPVIVNGSDSLALAPVGLYGRTRWYQYQRSGEAPLGGADEVSYRYSDRPDTYAYSQTVPYAEWMNGAQLALVRQDYSCCRNLVGNEYALLGNYRDRVFAPKAVYLRPVNMEAAKTRTLAGRAYIDFPVNRTELYPDYRRNPIELAKIVATIDSVRNDSDVTIERITIKGWASPESPWENNTRLAKGRTATLKQYVIGLYHFADSFIETDYYPEDWEGLRAYVAQSSLEHRAEILAIIDDATLAPDPKEQKIKTSYPQEYKFLLETIYPGLRHSDYTIQYTIRNYTDVNEIRRVLAVAPQKLSLTEMYLLAETLEPGSEDFNELFETAVRMYPNDETANLNAANAAIDRKDYKQAERYLQKAGKGAEAQYARGRLAALQGDAETAVKYFGQAAATMPEAAEALEQLREF